MHKTEIFEEPKIFDADLKKKWESHSNQRRCCLSALGILGNFIQYDWKDPLLRSKHVYWKHYQHLSLQGMKKIGLYPFNIKMTR